MDTNIIKEAITNALALLDKEVETEIIQETKAEYRSIILQLERALKELDR